AEPAPHRERRAMPSADATADDAAPAPRPQENLAEKSASEAKPPKPRTEPQPPQLPSQPTAAQHAPAPAAEARPTQPPRHEAAPAEGSPAPRALETESAEVSRHDDRTRFQLVVRDERLGRVSLNLTERAGLIDLMVRADKSPTARALQTALPTLVDSLARHSLAAEPMAYAPTAQPAGAPEDAEQRRERRERRQHEWRPRVRARRVAQAEATSTD
ncbi:MAG: hypothetical protein R2724_29130, partial [Bryobacterales bacterium]